MLRKITLSLTSLIYLVGLSFGTAVAQSSATGKSTSADQQTKEPPLVQCPVNSTLPNKFALCATATCWTLDGVAYCKCEVLNEQSISLSFEYEENGKSKDVCDLLLEGNRNGFTVSTYATPRQVESDYNPKTEKLGPPMGYYTCPTDASAPAYGAQCDGGVCFTSTQGKEFPGLGHINNNEIVCSCPPTRSNGPAFQIAGPWSCEPGDPNEDNHCCSQTYYDQMCNVTRIKQTGTIIAVNAPIGVPKTLSTILDGKVPKLNSCRFNKPSGH